MKRKMQRSRQKENAQGQRKMIKLKNVREKWSEWIEKVHIKRKKQLKWKRVETKRKMFGWKMAKVKIKIVKVKIC